MQTYSDGNHTWAVEDLWQEAEGQTARRVPLADLDVDGILDSRAWTVEGDYVYALTVQDILDHWQRVEGADLAYPIILTPDGDIADGYHRVIKAYRLGHLDILAVRLCEMPLPL